MVVKHNDVMRLYDGNEGGTFTFSVDVPAKQPLFLARILTTTVTDWLNKT
jgi:hypothetical protein